MSSGILDLARARGNSAIVLTIIAWMTFGAMGATIWNILLKGIWTEIGAAFVQGILSAAAIFAAFWLQKVDDRMTRTRDAENAAEEARRQDRKELIFTFGLIESVQRLFEQICKTGSDSTDFDGHKDAYIAMIQQELLYLNSINCMQMSDDKYISAIANLKKLTILMFILISKEVFDIKKAKDVLKFLNDDMSDLFEEVEQLNTGAA